MNYKDELLKWSETQSITLNTMKSYARVLEIIESLLQPIGGVTLDVPLLEIGDYDTFVQVSDRIEKMEGYPELNRSYQNQIISAALHKYAAFLRDREIANNKEKWWPMLSEYDPGITKEQWLAILNNPDIIGPVWGGALAMFYAEPEGATCSALSIKYGKQRSSIIGNCTQLAKRVQAETGCPINKRDNGKDGFWPILFQGRDTKDDELGNWVWRMRPELYEACKEFGIEKYLPQTDDEWWPTLSEYDPGITKEQWIELLNNPAVSGKDPTWVIMMAMYYAAKDGATCTQAGKRFGFSGQSVRSSCTQFAIWVQNNTGCPTAKKEDGKDSYWPILFQGRDAKKEEDGVYVWRMRPELYDACTEFDILRFLPKEGDEPTVRTNMSPQEALPRIKEYIAAKGFSYPEGLIENYWLSLKSKPFVILAGTSGTGKTRLVRLFAEAIGAGYHLVSVRPDWSDGSDLFGHTDLNGTFHPGPVCAAFDEAIKEPDKPVFLCLDEMNLARVEYYLSDFLSVIESRRKAGNRVSTDGIAQYGEGIPDNLYVVGTVNMDETTFPFSKKVLDRANTIEFSYVDLTPDFEAARGQAEALALSNSFLRTEYLVLTADCAEEESFVKKVCGELQEINDILKKANAHVGYRVRDEIVFYLLNNEKAGKLLKYEQAMDNEIMQKILPRIQGSSMAVKTLLMDLFKFCMGSGGGLDADSGNVGEQMKNAAESARYPESAQKIGYMMTRFEDDGFTSYWL